MTKDKVFERLDCWYEDSQICRENDEEIAEIVKRGVELYFSLSVLWEALKGIINESKS